MEQRKYDPEKHHRRSIRLKEYDYSQTGAYFITICAYNKECIFGDVVDGKIILNQYGEIVKAEWLKTFDIRKNLILDKYIVMPNHFHGIIMIVDGHDVGATRRVAPTKRPNGPVPASIGAIIGQFKSIVTKRINAMRNTTGLPVWQRNYYEHIIRNEDELNQIREYIADNPIKWELDEENPINVGRVAIKFVGERYRGDPAGRPYKKGDNHV